MSFFCLCIFSAFRAYCAQIRPAASAGRGGKEHIMNATVNSNCIGCGLCVSICPEVFEIGDDGLAQPIQEVTETLEKTASQARESCPVNAIDLE
ncbi:ferredoxin [Clostridium sp. DFI.5.61]|nr:MULTISPECIES: ferredoxin [Clostridium]MCB5924747.1 ferredoxin [bacterium 210820-DFI.5.26]MCQ5160236.1 ferredoxin [Clostridium sp. DFI.5.61]MEE0112284.1 ferredoxin [Eubacteriales bacterium]